MAVEEVRGHSIIIKMANSISIKDKKTVRITLVEEDIAKLRYEVVYLDELMSKQKLTLNRVAKRWRRKDFSRMEASFAQVAVIIKL